MEALKHLEHVVADNEISLIGACGFFDENVGIFNRPSPFRLRKLLFVSTRIVALSSLSNAPRALWSTNLNVASPQNTCSSVSKLRCGLKRNVSAIVDHQRVHASISRLCLPQACIPMDGMYRNSIPFISPKSHGRPFHPSTQIPN